MPTAENMDGDSIVLTYQGTIEDEVRSLYRFLDTVVYGQGNYVFDYDAQGKNVDVTVKIDGVPQTVAEGQNTYLMGDGSEIDIQFVWNEPAKIVLTIHKYIGTGNCQFPLQESFNGSGEGYNGNWRITETGTTLTPTAGNLIAEGVGTAVLACDNLALENTQVILETGITGDEGDVSSVTIKGPSDAEVTFHFLPAEDQAFDSTNIDASSVTGVIRLRDYDTELNGGITGIEVNMEVVSQLNPIPEGTTIWLGKISETGGDIEYVSGDYPNQIDSMSAYTRILSTANENGYSGPAVLYIYFRSYYYSGPTWDNYELISYALNGYTGNGLNYVGVTEGIVLDGGPVTREFTIPAIAAFLNYWGEPGTSLAVSLHPAGWTP